MTNIQEQNFILKTFQLRAARMVAGIELRTIGQYLGFTKAAISAWEHKDNFTPLNTSKENVLMLKEVFIKHNIFFPDENSISLNKYIKENNTESLTRFQLKAARTILNLSQRELANIFNITQQTIARGEFLKNNEYIRPLNKKIPIMLREWFESKNIVFQDNFNVSFFKDKKIY